MPKYLNRPHLKRLRNEIDIAQLIAGPLQIPHKTDQGRFRFLCPLCQAFNTATNPRTNLARCFYCKKNFNPIDITMAEKKLPFLEAIKYLEPWLASDKSDS